MHASKWATNYSGRAEPATARGGSIFPLAGLLQRLNELGGRHGIGRLDLVENRFVGMKSRGVYETPGGTIQQAAHRAIESLTLDRGAAHPESEMLQALIDKSQDNVGGVVRLKLYKGSATVVGRRSPKSLHSLAHVTFEEDAVYDQRDAEGFIKLNALRLAARRGAFNVEPPWAGEGRDAGKAAPRDGTEES